METLVKTTEVRYWGNMGMGTAGIGKTVDRDEDENVGVGVERERNRCSPGDKERFGTSCGPCIYPGCG
jgi:hypothetical protein